MRWLQKETQQKDIFYHVRDPCKYFICWCNLDWQMGKYNLMNMLVCPLFVGAGCDFSSKQSFLMFCSKMLCCYLWMDSKLMKESLCVPNA